MFGRAYAQVTQGSCTFPALSSVCFGVEGKAGQEGGLPGQKQVVEYWKPDVFVK